MIGQAGQQAAKIIEEARAAAGVVAEQERQRAIAGRPEHPDQGPRGRRCRGGPPEGRAAQGIRTPRRAEAAARSTEEVLSADQKVVWPRMPSGSWPA